MVRYLKILVDDMKEVDPMFRLNEVHALNNFLAHFYIAPESLDKVSFDSHCEKAVHKGETWRG